MAVIKTNKYDISDESIVLNQKHTIIVDIWEEIEQCDDGIVGADIAEMDTDAIFETKENIKHEEKITINIGTEEHGFIIITKTIKCQSHRNGIALCKRNIYRNK